MQNGHNMAKYIKNDNNECTSSSTLKVWVILAGMCLFGHVWFVICHNGSLKPLKDLTHNSAKKKPTLKRPSILDQFCHVILGQK